MMEHRSRLPVSPLSMEMNGRTQQQDTGPKARNHQDVCATSSAMRGTTSTNKFILKSGSSDALKARARPTSIHRPRESSATAPLPLLGDYDDTTLEQRGHNSTEPITSSEGHGEHPP